MKVTLGELYDQITELANAEADLAKEMSLRDVNSRRDGSGEYWQQRVWDARDEVDKKRAVVIIDTEDDEL